MDSDVERQLRAFAMVRIGIGAALLVAPGLALRRWLGADADRPTTRLLARMAGGRDLALGIGLQFALRHGAPVRGWLEAGALSDASDLVGSLLALRSIPRLPLAGSAASALGAVVYGRRLVSLLPPA